MLLDAYSRMCSELRKCWNQSVPVIFDGMRLGGCGTSIAFGDVLQSPIDLDCAVILPVGSHLGSGERLGNAVCIGAGIVGIPSPTGLLVPQPDQGGPFGTSPSALRRCACGIGLGLGDGWLP